MTKKLLEIILGNEYKPRLVETIKIEDNLIVTYYDCGTGKFDCLGLEYNIYELAHKCKEWAHNNNYWMDSCFTGQIKLYKAGGTYPFKTLHTEITEPEGIFAACEWVLEQKDK